MKKRISGLFVVVLAIFMLVLTGCQKNEAQEDRAEADIDWQMISPEKMKEVLEKDDASEYQIIDIQPKADYAKGHLPHSISVPAYPVDTEDLEKLVVDSADQFQDSDKPIYVVCPGGGGGAKRTISLLIDEGIDEYRLFIVENGAKKWPYKEDSKLWVSE